MSLEVRKIEFVQEFLKLQSEEAISRFEKLLKKESLKAGDDQFKPLTIDEFNDRINQSMEDSKKGRVIEENEVKDKISKWS